MNYYVGVDIGGTRIKLGIIDEDGKVCVHDNEASSVDRIALMKQVENFVKRYECEYEIQGVGISVPGVVREDGFLLTSGAVKCLLQRNMKQEFEAVLQYPIHIENDCKCAAIAEKWIGAATKLTDFVCITLGTAVGGAIYINGELYRGLGGFAGDYGVTLVGSKEGDYGTQSTSCHAGVVAGLCRNYSLKKKQRILDAKVIYELAKQGEADAMFCIKEFHHEVAVLLVNITASIAPEQILIGGGISNNQDAMQGIKDAYEKIQQDYHVLTLVEMPELLTCRLKNEAGMVGAVYPLIKRK